MLAEKTCADCGARFQPNSGRQRYCSDCGRRGQAVCVICGTTFKPTSNSAGKYCSRQCMRMGVANPESHLRPCPVCGTVFKPRGAYHRTCSRKCGGLYRRAYSREPRICQTCGKQFQDEKHPHTIYCSRECAGVARRESRPAACERCGKPLPFDRYRHRRFCSAECKGLQSGTKRTNRYGYIMLKVGKDVPGATSRGWMQEHRYVMQQQLGRPLEGHERVHHKNADRTDNRPENLELWVGRHEGPGARVADLINDILGQPEVDDLLPNQRAGLRKALQRVLGSR